MDWHIPTTSAFVDLSPDNYFFFRLPEDLYNISTTHLDALTLPPILVKHDNGTTSRTRLATGCFPKPVSLGPAFPHQLGYRPVGMLDSAIEQHLSTNITADTVILQLANTSTSILAQPLSTPYHPPENSLHVTKGQHFLGLRGFARAVWWRIQCDFMSSKLSRRKRPNRACTFDRQPGQVFLDGTVEPKHDTWTVL